MKQPCGMGGVGKTELALQYARSQSNQGSYAGGVCWLEGRKEDLGIQLLRFGRTFLELKPPEDLDLLSQVQYCWHHWSPGQVLVVLDDVVDYAGIKAYLPHREARFSLLLTTRQKLGASIQQLDLNLLSPAAALELLRTNVEDEDLEDDQDRIEEELEEAKALCERLGYLPLALELVGRYLRWEKDLSLREMARELEDISLEADALVERDEDLTAQRGVAAAFELSWQGLEEKARLLGCRLSLFAVAPIFWSLVARVGEKENPRDLRKVRQVLQKFNLLKRIGKETYQLHQLIKEFFRGKLEQLAQADEYKSSFCQVMVGEAQKMPDTPTRQDIEALRSSIPHVREAARAFTHWIRDEDLIWPFVGLGRFYRGQGDYEGARPWFEQCLSLSRVLRSRSLRDRLGQEHPAVAISLNNLAALYYSQGRYEAAEPFYLEALEMFKYLLGEQHPAVATSLNNLAALYWAQGRYEEAEPLYIEALQMRKHLLREEHPAVATSFNNLAELYRTRGRYEEAEPLISRSSPDEKALVRRRTSRSSGQSQQLS